MSIFVIGIPIGHLMDYHDQTLPPQGEWTPLEVTFTYHSFLIHAYLLAKQT